MPKTKKEEEKKTLTNNKASTKTKKAATKKATTKKSTKTASKKTSPRASSSKKKSAKKTVAKKDDKEVLTDQEGPIKKKASKAITIDVIADDDSVLYEDKKTDNDYEPEGVQDGAKFDAQKKFFSQLVDEMKEKKQNFSNDEKASTNFAEEIEPVKRQRKSLNLYRRIALRSGMLTLILILIVSYFFLPSLKISIQPSFEIVSDTVPFMVVTDESKVDSLIANNYRQLNGEMQFFNLSTQKVYEATGEEVLGQEVTGIVTLHNEYSRSQPLVVNTRLLSPDNKLYRLKESVNIPAGETVEVEVYADQVSPDMAIGPTSFTIPGLWLGLQDRIYATSDEAFEYKHQIKRYVRQSDLDQAMIDVKNILSKKAELTIESLKSSQTNMAHLINDEDLKIEINAKLKEETSDFLVSAENELIIVFFPQDQAENLVKGKLAFLLDDDKRITGFSPDNIVYRIESYDRDLETANVNAAFRANMTLRTDADIIDRRQLAGLSHDQIAEYLRSFPEIDSYSLQFFPNFIKRAPSLPDRIKIDVVN